MELSLLAAFLDPQACTGTGAKDVLEKALDLYMVSTFKVGETKRLSPEGLHERYVTALSRLGFTDEYLEAVAKANKLRLYHEDQADDPTKDYLLKHSGAGLRDWKKTRTVLEAIKKYFIRRANAHNTENAKGIAELEAKHHRMAAERGVTPQRLRDGMVIPSDQLWLDAEKDYADFLDHLQVPGPEFDHGKKISSKIEYWEIPMDFLEQIISWRHELKKQKVDWKGIRLLTREEIFGSEKPQKAAKIKNPK
jgi:hypothetical protein